MPHLLIADDEQAISWSLKKHFQAEGYTVDAVSSAEAAIECASKVAPDAIILDVRLPGISGLEAIPKLKSIAPSAPIVLITAFGDLSTAIEAYRLQVSEYLTKPFDLDRASEIIRNLLSSSHQSAAEESASAIVDTISEPSLIGCSPVMQEVFKKIALAANSDVPVLITGESGTGKELTAAAIHRNSGRRNHPYIPVALPALPPSLIESELFGHVKGAFTGANENREGLFALASGGTVLLDEIGDLPLPQQVKLLRVLEQGHYTPVGDIRPRRCDVRIIAATHQDLPSRIAEGEFRQDLFFRLAVFEIRLPPLRERREDIPLLCHSILSRLRYSHPQTSIDTTAMTELQQRRWIGNVRELRNTLEHAALMARGGPISLYHLPAPQTMNPTSNSHSGSLSEVVESWARQRLSDQPDSQTNLFEQFLDETEPSLLRVCLEATKGNKANAATLLGIHRATLREKLRRHGMADSDG